MKSSSPSRNIFSNLDHCEETKKDLQKLCKLKRWETAQTYLHRRHLATKKVVGFATHFVITINHGG